MRRQDLSEVLFNAGRLSYLCAGVWVLVQTVTEANLDVKSCTLLTYWLLLNPTYICGV